MPRTAHGTWVPSLPVLAGLVVAAGSLAAVMVPTIQGVVVWRTSRPPVPGPHPQDGLLSGRIGAEPVRFVWLGDSLASGVGANTPDASFPRKSAALSSVASGRPVQLTCLATPGACASDVLERQVPVAVAALGPGSVAIVTVGANDVGNGWRPRRFRREYATILSRLAKTGATVIAIGLPHMGSAAVLHQPLRGIIGLAGVHADRQVRRLAIMHGALYVHIAVRAPRGTQPLTYLAADRWHPNDDTYHLWADRVAALVSPLLLAPAV